MQPFSFNLTCMTAGGKYVLCVSEGVLYVPVGLHVNVINSSHLLCNSILQIRNLLHV